MTLIDYFTTRYQFAEGENGALQLRRKSKKVLGIFGRGRNAAEEPFRTVRESLPVLLKDARAAVGPCTRAQVVDAVHQAGEIQALAEMRARKESR